MAKATEGRFSTTHSRKTDFNKTWYIELHTGGHTACKLWLRSGDVGGLGKWPVCHVFFLFFFVFFAKPIWSHCRLRQIWTSEGSKRVVPRKEVAFVGQNVVTLNFQGQPPLQKNSNFGGVNRTFKPEQQKIQIIITWKLLSWSSRNFYRR